MRHTAGHRVRTALGCWHRSARDIVAGNHHYRCYSDIDYKTWSLDLYSHCKQKNRGSRSRLLLHSLAKGIAIRMKQYSDQNRKNMHNTVKLQVLSIQV